MADLGEKGRKNSLSYKLSHWTCFCVKNVPTGPIPRVLLSNCKLWALTKGECGSSVSQRVSPLCLVIACWQGRKSWQPAHPGGYEPWSSTQNPGFPFLPQVTHGLTCHLYPKCGRSNLEKHSRTGVGRLKPRMEPGTCASLLRGWLIERRGMLGKSGRLSRSED